MTPAAVGSGRREGGRVVWQLLLTLWVGSVWSLHFVFLPTLEQSGLAPLLVDDAALTLRPAVLGISAVAMLLQLFVLVVRVRGAIWRDVRAQVLVLALAAVAQAALLQEGVKDIATKDEAKDATSVAALSNSASVITSPLCSSRDHRTPGGGHNVAL